MFLRVVRAAGGKGVKHEYVRVVEGARAYQAQEAGASCRQGTPQGSVHFTREQAYEGKYVIQTEELNQSAVDAVRLDKELSEVERAFADLKDVLELRPIYHQIDSRVQAHIYVAAQDLIYASMRRSDTLMELAAGDANSDMAQAARLLRMDPAQLPSVDRLPRLPCQTGAVPRLPPPTNPMSTILS
jgi:hypothetical protein